MGIVDTWHATSNFKIMTHAFKKILQKLNSNNKSHSRHFTYDSCAEIGLKVKRIEEDQELQNIVLSIHHAFIITLDASTASKIIENQNGNRFITTQTK